MYQMYHIYHQILIKMYQQMYQQVYQEILIQIPYKVSKK